MDPMSIMTIMNMLNKPSPMESIGGFGTGIYSAYKAGKRAEELEGMAVPEYQESETFKGVQEQLKGFGEQVMSGDIPSYFAPIGEMGSKEFEDMLSLTKRDITTSAQEALAKQGNIRGGALPAITSKAISDAAIKGRFADYQRALSGRGSLLGVGQSALTSVLGSSASEEARKNQYALNKFKTELGLKSAAMAEEERAEEGIGSAIGSLFSIFG